jgi:hypothetical protein
MYVVRYTKAVSTAMEDAPEQIRNAIDGVVALLQWEPFYAGRKLHPKGPEGERAAAFSTPTGADGFIVYHIARTQRVVRVVRLLYID